VQTFNLVDLIKLLKQLDLPLHSTIYHVTGVDYTHWRLSFKFKPSTRTDSIVFPAKYRSY